MVTVRDFDDVVRESVAAREAALGTARPGPGLAGTVAAIRRRRRRRHAGEAFAAVSAAAALVVVLVVAGGGGGPDVHPVAPTASPSPSATPTDVASPTPSATPTTAPPAPLPSDDEIAAGLGLPAVEPLPEDVWERVGAGWVLGVYRPTWELGDGETHYLRNTLVLADPAGEAYVLHELPLDREVEVVRWDAESTRALVTVAEISEDGITATSARAWLDLRTGEMTTEPGAAGQPDDGFPAQLRYLGTAAGGEEVWAVTFAQTGGGGPATVVVQRPDGTEVQRFDLGWEWSTSRIDPTGRYLAVSPDDLDADSFDVVELTTGETSSHAYGVADRHCQAVGWSAPGELTAVCQAAAWSETYLVGNPEPGSALYTVPVEGGAPTLLRELGEGDPAVEPWSGVTAPDGAVAVDAVRVGPSEPTWCESGLYLAGPAGVTLLRGDQGLVDLAGSSGGLLYGQGVTGCDDEGDLRGGTFVGAWDGDSATVLLPPPLPVAPELGDGVRTFVVAGGPWTWSH